MNSHTVVDEASGFRHGGVCLCVWPERGQRSGVMTWWCQMHLQA